jgi:hypothetical protein
LIGHGRVHRSTVNEDVSPGMIAGLSVGHSTLRANSLNVPPQQQRRRELQLLTSMPAAPWSVTHFTSVSVVLPWARRGPRASPIA